MKVRLTLLCTLLLLAASPSFALPLCQECNLDNFCEVVPGAIERCYDGPGYCYTTPERCSIPSESTVLADWKVSSIEINRPAPEPVTTPATPSPRTIELK